MADLEQRVATLEREMSTLKSRVSANEQDLQTIPELIKTEFRLTNSQIARQLWVTEQTVKFHLSNTYRKLGVANRTEASRYAHVHDLVAA